MIIRPATEADHIAFYGHLDPSIRDLHCAEIDGRLVAMSGVMRDPRLYGSLFEESGRWICFLELARDAGPLGWPAVVAMRHFLKTQTEPMIVQHDHEEPKAARLLAALGFTPTDEYIPDFRKPSRKLRTWSWQPPQQ